MGQKSQNVQCIVTSSCYASWISSGGMTLVEVFSRIVDFLFFMPLVIFSQTNILNAKSPDEIGLTPIDDELYASQEPLDYGFISEKDVLYSKTIWEEINLDERVNFPLYFPIDTLVVGNERRHLIHYLLNDAMEGYYPIYKKDNFKDLLYEDVFLRNNYP